MSLQESWEKALKHTEVVRPRVLPLLAHATTHLPYVFLAESLVNAGDTVVRKGDVLVDKPSIILPSNLPQFEGFDFEKDFPSAHDFLSSFFLVRGVRFPSLKYQNKTESLDVYEGQLQKAIDHYSHHLAKEENVAAGLVVGPEDCWQFSILIFTCLQAGRSVDQDIRRLLDGMR